MNSKKLIILFTLLTAVGCKQLLLQKMELTQPKLETPKSLTAFLEKYHVSKDIAVYVFESKKSLDEGYSDGWSIPDASFYNKQGYFVNYKLTPTDCNAQVGPFIENAQSINTMAYDENNHLSYYEGKLAALNTGESLLLSNEAHIDAYIVIRWAKYLGKINVDKSFEWIKVVAHANQNGSKIKLIFLNCDYQKSWDITEKDLPNFNYR